LVTFLNSVSRSDCRWILAVPNDYGVFNSDPHRARIAEVIADRTTCRTAIETGTFLGETTRWLAQHYERVVTIEAHPAFATFARFRIENQPNIELIRGDSAVKFGDALKSITGAVFVYLDAHWGSLPIVAELAALDRRTDYCCMIDDFEIEGTKFGFDEYGGTRIGVELLRRFAPSVRRIFVPDYPPELSGPYRRHTDAGTVYSRPGGQVARSTRINGLCACAPFN
jgi:hypothetical protein